MAATLAACIGAWKEWIAVQVVGLPEANGAILLALGLPKTAFVFGSLVRENDLSFESILCDKLFNTIQHCSADVHMDKVIWNRHAAERWERNGLMLLDARRNGT